MTSADPVPALLDCEDIHIRLGGRPILEGISVGIRAGEILGVVGPNGAGKTTLFELLSGRYVPDRGRVVLGGQDITALKLFARARLGLGRTYQSPVVPDALTVAEVFRAATQGGAAALGFEKCGQLAPGFYADIVFLDLASPNWTPHNNSVNQLVHVEDARAVKHVMVAGSFIVRDGKLTRIDMARLAAEAEAARARLEEATADAKALYAKLAPVVASYCPGLAQVPYHLDRYLDSTPRF